MWDYIQNHHFSKNLWYKMNSVNILSTHLQILYCILWITRNIGIHKISCLQITTCLTLKRVRSDIIFLAERQAKLDRKTRTKSDQIDCQCVILCLVSFVLMIITIILVLIILHFIYQNGCKTADTNISQYLTKLRSTPFRYRDSWQVSVYQTLQKLV